MLSRFGPIKNQTVIAPGYTASIRLGGEWHKFMGNYFIANNCYIFRYVEIRPCRLLTVQICARNRVTKLVKKTKSVGRKQPTIMDNKFLRRLAGWGITLKLWLTRLRFVAEFGAAKLLCGRLWKLNLIYFKGKTTLLWLLMMLSPVDWIISNILYLNSTFRR